jgi:hypothetical protein
MDPKRDAMSEVLAVNVLLEPDEAASELARALNALLLRRAPMGFAFDETHLPHATLLQRYVRRADLDAVVETVGAAVAGTTSAALRLRARGLGGGEFGTPPGTVLASVEFEPQPAVRTLHDAVLRAVTPLAAGGGTAAAFFTLPGEPQPNAPTVTYVEEFVPLHSGEHYTPHLSVGVATENAVTELGDHPLVAAEVRPSAVCVAQLGNLGTARLVLRRWPLG